MCKNFWLNTFNVINTFIHPLKIWKIKVFQKVYKKISDIKCGNVFKSKLFVPVCEKSSLILKVYIHIVQKGSTINFHNSSTLEIQNRSTLQIQNSSTIEIQNSYTLDIQKSYTLEIQKSSNFAYFLIYGNFS